MINVDRVIDRATESGGIAVTQTPEKTRTFAEPVAPERTRNTSPAARRPATVWWKRPWIVPLALLVAAFLVFYIWPHYISFNPADATIKLVKTIPFHYGLLLVHITGCTVAVATLVAQMWPWLRRKHPIWHRWIGRVYVWAGTVPGTVAAITLMVIRTHRDGGIDTDPGTTGLYINASLWLLTALIGYRMARQHRWADHRKWMTYSFALGLANIYARPIAGIVVALHGDINLFFTLIGWLPFIVNLVLAQAWLDYKAGRPWINPKASRRARQSLAARQESGAKELARIDA